MRWCRPTKRELRETMRRFTEHGCETYTTGLGSCFTSGRTAFAKYGADSACVPCIAHRVLNGEPK